LATFLLDSLSDERGRLLRTYRGRVAKIDAYLEDYANVANGLLELYFATGELRWLEDARRLADLAVDLFADVEQGGFFVAAHDGDGLVARRKEFDDHPTPSGNSMIAFVLLRLARLYGDGEFEQRAVSAFRLALPLVERAPSAVGWMLCALDLHFSASREIAVVGPPDDPATLDLRRAALTPFEPNAVFAFSAGAEDEAAARVPLLAGKGVVQGRPAVYVCENFACRAPAVTADDVRALLGAT
ncbi:MAG: thioredoxin domain-containing protein, partial [Actinomycetota bacterium]|nr:thioredoxin domain-containing protein [Actinomycetota bacterium]